MDELIVKKLFDTTLYLVAVFDKQDKIIYSNAAFSEFFEGIKSGGEILEKFKIRKDIEFKRNISYVRRVRTVVKSDENEDHMFKFEISSYGDYKLAVGIKLDYKDILRLGEDIVAKDFVRVDDMYKLANDNMRDEGFNAYATFIFNSEMSIKHVSPNAYELFGYKSGKGQNMEDVFEMEYVSLIKQKMVMIDVFGSVSIDCNGNFASISRHGSKYYVLNIYPYSKGTNDRFEEIQSLSRRVKNLEIELGNKNKLIKAQKMIFENITSIDDMTKLYNRNSFFKNIESEIFKAKKLKYPIVVTILKLENLKEINLAMGTGYGDEALRELAAAIKGLSRKGLDIGHRISSHEFSIISLDSNKENTKCRFEKLKELTVGEMNMNMRINAFDVDLSNEPKQIISKIVEMTHNI